MNTKTYNKDEIIAYLLGNLPKAETEIFDELSFIDDAFAELLKAAEKDLVDAYVQGELTGKNLELFESFYLASPLRREKVEFAKAFQTFAEKEFTPIVSEEKPQKVFWTNLFKIPRFSLQWGFAALALAFLFFGGWLFWENSRLRSEIGQTQEKTDEIRQRETELAEREKQLQDEVKTQQNVNGETEKELAKVREEREKLEQELKKRQEQQKINDQKRRNEQLAETKKTPASTSNRSINIATFILPPPVRGSAPTLSIPAGTNRISIQLELESDDFPAYRAVLRNPVNGQVLWQSGNLKAKIHGGNKVLNVGFSANLLKTQIYSLEVSGISPDGSAEIIGDYSFRIVR